MPSLSAWPVWAVVLLLAAGPLAAQEPEAEPVAVESSAAKKPRQDTEQKQPSPTLVQEEPPAWLRAADDGGGLLDLEWLEMQPRIGIAVFSDDFKIDPSPAISLLFHAPMPFLSLSEPGDEHFGAFLELTVLPSVERDLNPAPDNNSGAIFLLSAGLDYTIVRNQALYLVVSGGVQYASYGGIADLSDGLGGMAGLSTGVYLGGGLTLTVSGEYVFADDGNYIGLGSLGLVVEF